jgi:hypothetical protein
MDPVCGSNSMDPLHHDPALAPRPPTSPGRLIRLLSTAVRAGAFGGIRSSRHGAPGERPAALARARRGGRRRLGQGRVAQQPDDRFAFTITAAFLRRMDGAKFLLCPGSRSVDRPLRPAETAEIS